jgi:hypothetical protein
MDQILDSKRWTPRETELLNYWRLYLGVETILDMTDGTGTRLLRSIRKQRRASHSHLTIDWPRQAKPWSSEARCTWNKYIDSITTFQNKLIQPLGPWINTDYQEWKCYYNQDQQTVYIKHQQSWQEYKIHHKERRFWKLAARFEHHHSIKPLLPDFIPTTYHSQLHQISPPSPSIKIQQELPPILCFSQFITTLPQWEKDLLMDQYEIIPQGDVALTLAHELYT